MRRLVLTQNTTLDGRADMLGDWFDDQAAGQDEVNAENARQREAADALLVGRGTFESFRDYWRDLASDRTGVSDYLSQVHKCVVSTTLAEPDWDNTTVLRGDPVDEVRRLREAPGRDIVCTGSVVLSHALLRAGLVHEVRLFVSRSSRARAARCSRTTGRCEVHACRRPATSAGSRYSAGHSPLCDDAQSPQRLVAEVLRWVSWTSSPRRSSATTSGRCSGGSRRARPSP
ncbi:MAG: dihydrofolate reductase family protein [Dermatophilaceae bacterium]